MSVSRVERGVMQPSLYLALQLARGVGVPLGALAGESGEEEEQPAEAKKKGGAA